MTEIKDEIRELIKSALQGKTNKNKKVLLRIVDENEAVLLKAKTGLKLLDYRHVIDVYGINHTLKNHGDARKEAARGQIAVQWEDFEKIPEIINSENVIYSEKTNRGNDVLLYQAVIDDTYFYAVEVRSGRKELCIQSMYKRKPPKR